MGELPVSNDFLKYVLIALCYLTFLKTYLGPKYPSLKYQASHVNTDTVWKSQKSINTTNSSLDIGVLIKGIFARHFTDATSLYPHMASGAVQPGKIWRG